MPASKIKQVLNQSMQDLTSTFAGIELSQDDSALSDDICTVHTMLEGNHQAFLVLCADTALLTRLAQNIMCQDEVTAQDIEDVATEYFNVICGGIAAGLFQVAHVSSRFQSPQFLTGRYIPEGDEACQYVLSYNGGNNEAMQLIYMGLCPVSDCPST